MPTKAVEVLKKLKASNVFWKTKAKHFFLLKILHTNCAKQHFAENFKLNRKKWINEVLTLKNYIKFMTIYLKKIYRSLNTIFVLAPIFFFSLFKNNFSEKYIFSRNIVFFYTIDFSYFKILFNCTTLFACFALFSLFSVAHFQHIASLWTVFLPIARHFFVFVYAS